MTAATIVIPKDLVGDRAPLESMIRSTTVDEPVAVGVPDTTPPIDRLRPVGKKPDTNDQK